MGAAVKGRKAKPAPPELKVGAVRIIARTVATDGVPWDDVAIFSDGKFLAAFGCDQAAAVGLALRAVAICAQHAESAS